MIGTLLPEFVLHKTLVSIIEILREDLNAHENDEQNTILYKILGVDEEKRPLQINIYNIFTQAKKIITTPNNLSVNFGYNQEVANIISLHILLPSEQAQMTIGADEGYMEERLTDENGKTTAIQQYLTATYDTTYQIMITSNNSAEVLVVYNILKSMLLMLVPQLELSGLRLPSFSGQDIVMQDDLTPVPLYHKVLNISFKYEHNVPKMIVDDVVKRFYIRFRMVDYEA